MQENNVKEAIESIQKGGFVIVIDDLDRENEGDLIIAAEKVTEQSMAFMIRHTSGIICVPLKKERLDALELPQMAPTNSEIHRTAFTISVDSHKGTTTGISAADRVQTIRSLIDPATKPSDLNRPGHVFPLQYRDGGVLKRAGHTEAGVDLVQLAGLYPAVLRSTSKNPPVGPFPMVLGIVSISPSPSAS